LSAVTTVSVSLNGKIHWVQVLPSGLRQQVIEIEKMKALCWRRAEDVCWKADYRIFEGYLASLVTCQPYEELRSFFVDKVGVRWQPGPMNYVTVLRRFSENQYPKHWQQVAAGRVYEEMSKQLSNQTVRSSKELPEALQAFKDERLFLAESCGGRRQVTWTAPGPHVLVPDDETLAKGVRTSQADVLLLKINQPWDLDALLSYCEFLMSGQFTTPPGTTSYYAFRRFSSGHEIIGHSQC
jgi:hypothetical protein